MKSFEIKALGVEELSINEATNTEGGFMLGLAIALTIALLLLTAEEAY